MQLTAFYIYIFLSFIKFQLVPTQNIVSKSLNIYFFQRNLWLQYESKLPEIMAPSRDLSLDKLICQFIKLSFHLHQIIFSDSPYF